MPENASKMVFCVSKKGKPFEIHLLRNDLN